MATSFTSLPIIDLSPLRHDDVSSPPSEEARKLAAQFHDVFATSGFAYLTNLPLSFSHEDVFALSKQFFALPAEEKMRLAKRTFVKGNENTYRGYFPIQPLKAHDNLKEGFELGSGKVKTKAGAVNSAATPSAFNMYEGNVWPSGSAGFPASSRRRLTQFYAELQALSARLLRLLALSLGEEAERFDGWLEDSLSTLRLLHYPPNAASPPAAGAYDDDSSSISSGETFSTVGDVSASSAGDVQGETGDAAGGVSDDVDVKLSCTPHTDSGILTLLHQDPTGGLEVRNSDGLWVPAPYVPGSVVANIGDLMARVSGGRFVATMHRVRAPGASAVHGPAYGRFSVPFFFEPGEECVVKTLDGREAVRYGDHVRGKMATWVEFQDV